MISQKSDFCFDFFCSGTISAWQQCGWMSMPSMCISIDLITGRDMFFLFFFKKELTFFGLVFFENIFYSRNIDPGDISEQIALREKLQCKPFKWFMQVRLVFEN